MEICSGFLTLLLGASIVLVLIWFKPQVLIALSNAYYKKVFQTPFGLWFYRIIYTLIWLALLTLYVIVELRIPLLQGP